MTTTDKLRVLVVDDHEDTRELHSALLEQAGHAVVVADDGARALDLLLTEVFDAALVDIGLPTIDGYELARLVREGLREDAPSLIALSGYGRQRDSAADRFDAYFLKPIDPKQLVATIAAVTPNRRRATAVSGDFARRGE